MKNLLVFLSLIIFHIYSFAQQEILDKYIETGIENNLALKQKYSSYKKSMEAIREAKGLFFPDISLNARYSVSEGGRTIILPIGDLMNPVYSSLNGITNSMALMQQIPPDKIFPDTSISNENINFLRPTEHETKIRMVQPIINTNIWNNYKIQKELVNIEKADADTYKRFLVAEIKTAYFNYLKTINVLELLQNTENLLSENYRVSQKLFENDKVTYDVVLRSKAEISKLQHQIAEAEKNNKITQTYFNFLLNKPLFEEIEFTEWKDISLSGTDLETASNLALSNREELQTTNSYVKVANHNISLNQSTKLPTLTAVVDYGLQGAKYDFNDLDNQDYVMASLVMKWDLFKGFQNNSKTQQAKIDKEIIESQRKALISQINIQVVNAYYDVEASQQFVVAAESESESLQSVYKLVDKKYILGQANLLEFIDARNAMTNAQQKLILAKYDYLIKKAEFEKVTALYQFKN